MQLLRKVAAFMGRTDGSLQKKAIRAGFWVGVSSAAAIGLTFARSVVLPRLLEPEVFGLMAICLMATRLIEIFTETGFGAALIHRQQDFEKARDTAFTMAVLRGFGLALLSFATSPWVAQFYEQPLLAPVISVVGLSYVLSGFQNINLVALQKELDFKRVTQFELVGAMLKFVSIVGLAWWFRSVWALAIGQVAAAGIGCVLSFVMVPGRVRFRFDKATALELYRYGRFITGLAIVIFFTRELDNALIGKLLGMEMLGFYVAAYSLATLPADYLSRLFAKVIFPMFSKLQNDLPALRVEYIRGIRMIATVLVPVSVAMMVLAPEIVRGLLGERWGVAAQPLRILSAFGCFRALWMINGYLCNGIGKPYIDFYANLARLIVMGALLFPLTKIYGVAGSAVAVAAPMGLQFAAGVYLSRRFIGAPMAATLRPVAIAAGQSLVLAVVLIAAKSVMTVDPRIALVLLLGLGGAVYLALNARDIRSMLAATGVARSAAR